MLACAAKQWTPQDAAATLVVAALAGAAPKRAYGTACRGAELQCKLSVTAATAVWTGRALQAENDDLEKLVLRFCIRPIDGAFEPLAIMDIRARSISFATRPRRPDGPPDHKRAGETFLHLLFSDSQTSAGKPTIVFGISLSRQPFPW